MKNTIDRTVNSEKKRMTSWLLIAPCLLLLSGCGCHATVDRWQSKMTGDIDKQGKISAQELRKILIDHFGMTRIVLTDKVYILPDNGKVSDIQSEEFVYCNAQASDLSRPMDWDCDDYAAASVVPMRNYSFGTMYVTTEGGTKHAMNLFVNHRHEVKYWEPQTCQYSYAKFHKPGLIVF